MAATMVCLKVTSLWLFYVIVKSDKAQQGGKGGDALEVVDGVFGSNFHRAIVSILIF